MFWFLHYTVKVLIGLAIIGIGIVLYLNRHWFNPADEWVQTLRRAQSETLPILGETTGRVVQVPMGDRIVLRPDKMPPQSFTIAGIRAPEASRNRNSDQAQAFRRSRDFLKDLTLSNEVRVAYTFFVPEGGGVGGVYLGGSNLAVPMVSAGLAIVHDGSLKSLPFAEQIQLLAAEKEARDAQRGFWSNTVRISELVTQSGATN